MRPSANPSAVIATEYAFARLAQEKGQWTAFAETAAPDAEMFVPQRVKASAWLKGRKNPPVSVTWQPYEVWMSCDGSYAVTRGAWQRPNATGYFTTIWQRQKNGTYKWVLDQGDKLKQPLPAPDMLSGKVADCLRHSPAPDGAVAQPSGEPGDSKDGQSLDGSLIWNSTVQPDGARKLSVHYWKDGAMQQAVLSEVAAPPTG
jgi:hypothetical protein